MPPVRSEVVGQWARVILIGEFDLANAELIPAEVAELVESGVTDVGIDLGQVNFLGVSAINALVRADTIVRSVEGRLILIEVDSFTQQVLDILELNEVLHVFAPVPPSHPPSDDEGVAEDSGSDFEDDFTQSFYDLSQLLLSDARLSADLDRLVRTAVATVPDSAATSIALSAQGTSRTAATSSHIAIEIDVAQYEADNGPCLESAMTGQRIRVDVLDADERYEHFAALAIAVGVQTSLSVPILLGQEVVGSLNVYSMSPGAFMDEATAITDIIAGQAATAIHRSLLYGATRKLTDQIQQHSDRQAEIAHAEGALSILNRCSLEQAHQTLRSTATDSHESLVRAARRVLDELRPPAQGN